MDWKRAAKCCYFFMRGQNIKNDYHNFRKGLFNIKKVIFLKSYMLKKVPKNYSKDLVFHISPGSWSVGNYSLNTNCVHGGKQGPSLCLQADLPSGRSPRGHFSQTDRKAQPRGHPVPDHESFITNERTGPGRKRGALLNSSNVWRLRAGQPLAPGCIAGNTGPR